MIRCMNCMGEHEDGISICPHCGNDENITLERFDQLNSGTLLKNRFVVGNPLGRGGFGITYIAWDSEMHRKVAIKEYLPKGLVTRETGNTEITCDTESKDAFLHGIERTIEESRRLADFTGTESIVTAFDCFKENGTAYIVMELLSGETVKSHLQEKKKLSFDETMRIMTPILKSLSVVHKSGIIHRDISPDNIFLCDDGRVKLLDFGAARVLDEADERSRSIVIKHGYAPKEQYVAKGKQGPWTDVYSTCATMYKMLTGETPIESIERIDDDELTNVSALADLPSEAAAAIMQGLEVSEKNRIQSAEELLNRLQGRGNTPAEESDYTMTLYLPDAGKADASDNQAPAKNKDALKKPAGSSSGAADKKAPVTEGSQGRGLSSKVTVPIIVALILAVAILGSALIKRGNTAGQTVPVSETESAPTDITSTVKAVAATIQTTVTTKAPVKGTKTAQAATQGSNEKIDYDFSDVIAGQFIEFGHYEQNNNASDGKEAIVWRVLAVEDDSILIVSEKSLDCRKFNNEAGDYTWAECSLRSWLNGTFYDAAFNEYEKQMIFSTSVSYPDKYFSLLGNKSTEDRVFLLSYAEAEKYFDDDYDRMCVPTKYALANGAYVNNERLKEGEPAGWWWLRSAGDDDSKVVTVYSHGGYLMEGDPVESSGGAVRPAIWISK